MGLFSTLNTGVTGINVNGLSLSVVGDNLANLNTHGYKGSSAQFQDLIHQNLRQHFVEPARVLRCKASERDARR